MSVIHSIVIGFNWKFLVFTPHRTNTNLFTTHSKNTLYVAKHGSPLLSCRSASRLRHVKTLSLRWTITSKNMPRYANRHRGKCNFWSYNMLRRLSNIVLFKIGLLSGTVLEDIEATTVTRIVMSYAYHVSFAQIWTQHIASKVCTLHHANSSNFYTYVFTCIHLLSTTHKTPILLCTHFKSSRQLSAVSHIVPGQRVHWLHQCGLCWCKTSYFDELTNCLITFSTI